MKEREKEVIQRKRRAGDRYNIGKETYNRDYKGEEKDEGVKKWAGRNVEIK